MQFFKVLFIILNFFYFSQTQYCPEIDSTPLVLECDKGYGNFIYNSTTNVETTLANDQNLDTSKYSVVIDVSLGTLTLNIKKLDKYDSGRNRYYTKISPTDISCKYNISVFSKNIR